MVSFKEKSQSERLFYTLLLSSAIILSTVLIASAKVITFGVFSGSLNTVVLTTLLVKNPNPKKNIF